MRKAAFQKVYEMAKQDERICLAVSDVAKENISAFQKEFPRRLFVEGIAEGHLIGMASGLAKEGQIVFVNTIASFLSKRAFEQIAINLCLEKTNVKLLAQGGGLVYGQQGPTHHALDDIALMRTLPGMTIFVPFDVDHVGCLVEKAVREPGPVYLRLAKGSGTVVTRGMTSLDSGPVVFKSPGKVLLVAVGTMVATALEVSKSIPNSGVVGIHTMKPFPHEELTPILNQADTVITIEEHSEVGGLGSILCETIVKYCDRKPKFKAFSLNDNFVRSYGKQEELLKILGLDAPSIVSSFKEHST